MEGIELEDLRRNWYNQTFVLMEIAKVAKNREFAFIGAKHLKEHLPAIRCMKCYAIDYLKMNFEKFRFYQRDFNAYISVSSFHDFPMFSFNPVERKKQLGDFFNLGGFEKCWAKYDFVMDIDNEDISKAHADASKVKKVLDEFSVPYSLRFSGRRGFHFLVKDELFFPLNTPNPEKVKIAYNIVKNMKEIEGIPSIDETIYDKERLIKCPYTLTGENVCLPLTDEQFARFDVRKMNWAYVQMNFMLKNRGLLERDKLINFKGLIDTFGEDNE